MRKYIMISRKRLAEKLVGIADPDDVSILEHCRYLEMVQTVHIAERDGGSIGFSQCYLYHENGGLWVIYGHQVDSVNRAHRRLLE